MADAIGGIQALTINPSLFAGGPSPSLFPGQQVSAQVLQAGDGQALISINGQSVLAESTVPLNPGDLIQLEFNGTQDGLLSLRLLGQNRSLAFTPLTMEDVSAQLASLKLPFNETTANMVKSMMEFNVPVTSESVMGLLQSAEGAPPNAPMMQAANFLQEAMLPTTPENIKTLAQFFQNRPELGTYLAQLQQFPMGNNGALNQLLSFLPTVVGSYLLNPKKDDPEKNADFINQLANFSGADGEVHSGTLPTLLSLLKAKLQQDSQESHPLYATLTGLQDLLNSEKLLNSDQRFQSWIYFQVPTQFLNKNVTTEVRMQYETDQQGKRFVNPDRSKLEFSMKTEGLGAIQFSLDILNRSVAAQIFVEPNKELFVEKHIEWLRESFYKLNFQITYIQIIPTYHDFWPFSKTEFGEIEKVNVRV